MRHVLGSLARRWLALHEEIKVHTRHLTMLTTTIAPRAWSRARSGEGGVATGWQGRVSTPSEY